MRAGCAVHVSSRVLTMSSFTIITTSIFLFWCVQFTFLCQIFYFLFYCKCLKYKNNFMSEYSRLTPSNIQKQLHLYESTFMKNYLWSVTLTFELQTWVLSATHCLNEIHIYVKLFQNPSINDKVMDRTQLSIYFYDTINLLLICKKTFVCPWTLS